MIGLSGDTNGRDGEYGMAEPSRLIGT